MALAWFKAPSGDETCIVTLLKNSTKPLSFCWFGCKFDRGVDGGFDCTTVVADWKVVEAETVSANVVLAGTEDAP